MTIPVDTKRLRQIVAGLIEGGTCFLDDAEARFVREELHDRGYRFTSHGAGVCSAQVYAPVRPASQRGIYAADEERHLWLATWAAAYAGDDEMTPNKAATRADRAVSELRFFWSRR